MVWSLTTTLGSAALAVALSSALQAQQKPPAVIVEVRDPSGQRVADANGFLRAEPRFYLAAVPTGLPPGVLAASASSNTVKASSNARGVLRFATPFGAAGSGMVTTRQGLGALVPRSQRPQRITLQPLAELITGTGSEPFAVVARANLPGHGKVTLPLMSGRKIRLPAGDYELWAACADGLVWQRARLQPGAQHQLRFTGSAQRLQLANGAHVHPAGIPELSLRELAQRGSDGGEIDQIAMRGTALAAPLVSWLDGIATPARVAPGPPTHTPLLWPPANDRLPRDSEFALADSAPAETSLLGLLRNDDDSFRIVAFANNVNGKLRMPECPRGDAWLLLLADNRAPTARPWSTMRPGTRLTPAMGQTLRIAARDAGNLPVADLLASYTPEGQEAATVIARTDFRGIADFGLVLGPGTLSLNDSRYANQTIELDLIPIEPLPLTATAGETLTGTASFGPGVASNNETIVVTLRDPTALLRPAQRTVVVKPGAPFTFGGLPEAEDLLLTATTQRAGKTWSARQAVHIGGGPVELVLRNEDPEFRPGK